MENILKYDVDCGCMATRKNYEVIVLSTEDKTEVLKLLFAFLESEPIKASMKIAHEMKDALSQKFYSVCVRNGWSLGMFQKSTGRLVAIFLGALHSKDFDSGDEFEFPHYMHLMNELEGDVYSEFNVHRYFETFICQVDPEFRRLGIQCELMTLLECVAWDFDCKLMTCLPTSCYSYKNHCKLGYEVAHQINYADYKHPTTGEKILANVAPPHIFASMMVKWL